MIELKDGALNLRGLIGTTIHYEIPAFQPPYVWTKDEQWNPCWKNVRRTCERVVAAGHDEQALGGIGGHILGPDVFEAKPAIARDVPRHAVIDGEQRTARLQVLLDAVHEVVLERGHHAETEALDPKAMRSAEISGGTISAYSRNWRVTQPCYAIVRDMHTERMSQDQPEPDGIALAIGRFRRCPDGVVGEVS